MSMALAACHISAGNLSAQLPDSGILAIGTPWTSRTSPYWWIDPSDLRSTPIEPNLVRGGVPSMGGAMVYGTTNPSEWLLRDHRDASHQTYDLMLARYRGRRLTGVVYYDHIQAMGGSFVLLGFFWRWRDSLVFSAEEILNKWPAGIYQIRPWPAGSAKLLTGGPAPGKVWGGLLGVLGDELVLFHDRQVYFYDINTKAVTRGPTWAGWDAWPESWGQPRAFHVINRSTLFAATDNGYVVRLTDGRPIVLGWVPGAPRTVSFGYAITYDPRVGLIHAQGNRLYSLGTPSVEIAHIPDLQGVWQLLVISHDHPSFITYGYGCAGKQPAVPWIDAPALPALGTSSFSVTLSQSPPASPATLLLGLSRTRLPTGSSLPLDLTPIGLPGCALETDVRWAFPTSTNSAGQAQIPLPIPNDALLAGQRATFQWVVRDPLQTTGPALIFSEGALAILR
jgi:hypothetical protein